MVRAVVGHRDEDDGDLGDRSTDDMTEDGVEKLSGTARCAGSDLGVLAASHRDLQQVRLALAQRGLDDESRAVKAFENRLARTLVREMGRHPLGPWLRLYPGLRGVHTARLIGLIDRPDRFPGQQCTNGHTAAPDFGIGSPCPFTKRDDIGCPGLMLPPRKTTGTRSLWKYLGMHVVDGASPHRRKGQRSDWNPKGRTALLQPGGIAEQIVRHRGRHARPEPGGAMSSSPFVAPVVRCKLGDDCRTYALGLLYETHKARLTETRAEDLDGTDAEPGPGLVDLHAAAGLRPGRIDAIARTIVAKRFAGDLLAAWKAAA